MSPTDLPAHVLSDLIRERKLSCRELMQLTLDRVAAVYTKEA